ncbi:hypothetical protein METBIDRAFT_76571 [Metschnikowia bicuspidata var. bicuspidata NRRL YB-4993]|uniref:Transmembrane 9 superfamily member n=1 Tax=Metschnikowia bicuspidata var. bicuspidata NRRL YB-4993 TaxID=869754 RepID=A0A1A0HI72_9ASCO|nr:hypothetical protein METBIDRAFT_76571 [Metschnikowia bicuspidata var. bicuspidata NRRL YB-4993]OBA23582.1 hypothetical protein METBIDRAFT_76571 [Metschnikowia bicuspidata var. bicuspidata NRRL YB-4993]
MLFLTVILFFLTFLLAFDLFAPKKYARGEKVSLLFNKIESDHTQLPYRYHDLPFVCYDKTQKAKTLLLGEVLKGDRFWESIYDLRFGVDQPCTHLCNMYTSLNGVARADHLIRNGYVVHWSLDGLPGATTFTSANRGSKYYAAGFPLGFVSGETAYLYNHVTIVVRYHREKSGLNAIVGFEIYPKSVNGNECPTSSKNYKNLPLTVMKDEFGKPVTQKFHIPYTYSVYWREDNSVTYNSRWDLYYDNETTATSSQIHMLSLVNSVLLKSDLQSETTIPIAYTDILGLLISSGLWKNLVHEVMGPPSQVAFLSTLCASGIQCLVAMLSVVIIFTINNKLSLGLGPTSNTFFNNHQGAFFSCSIVILLASGFVSASLGIIFHKLLSNDLPNTVYTSSKTRVLSCAFAGMFPFTIFSAVMVINLFVWAKESSNALPFGTIVILLLLFGIIELPLGILGGALGNRHEFSTDSIFVKSYVQSLEKHVVCRRSIVMSPISSILAFGLIPFGIVYVDLLFIFNSVWLEKTTFYYKYGFLLLTILLLSVVVAESAIVATYISLTVYNNPKWQWLCFRVSSSIGWYIFGYSIYYFIYNLQMSDLVSIIIYFSYMALVSAAVGVSCGAVGVTTALFFIRKIYGAVKRD